MDAASIDYIRHRLRRFSNSVSETREHFTALSPFGACCASAPYYEKYGILLLLDSMKTGIAEKEELCKEFRQILLQLEQLERDLGTPYRMALREELRAYTDAYHAAVCHENLCLIGYEADHDLFYRDRIAVLIKELEKDHDLSALTQLVGTLDMNLFPADPALQIQHQEESLPAPELTRRPGEKTVS